MSSPRKPKAVILAGPNGAGKSTSAPELLRGALGVPEFVNADVIAAGLSAWRPEMAAAEAARILLARLDALVTARTDIAFETTLAARTYVARLREWRAAGYETALLFLWLPDAETALQRVAARVRAGGHSIPESVVRTRHERGLRNFFTLYRSEVDGWMFYDARQRGMPTLIASGIGANAHVVARPELWHAIRRPFESSARA